MLSHILPLIQPTGSEAIYVEPFGGSGVVLMNKQPHLNEYYNDTDGDLVNLFRVIRDPDGVVHLWWELINTPVAREEFRDAIAAKKVEYSPPNPVKRAAEFVIRCRQRFGGGMTGNAKADSDRSWSTTRQSGRGMNDCVSKWLACMLHLPEVHRRFMRVSIDQQDATRCVKQFDTPSTLFYCDPPYVGCEAYYQGGFGAENHISLAGALNGIQGRAVVSYYPSDKLDELYPKARWNRRFVKTHASAAGHAPRDPNGKKGVVKENLIRTEMILFNLDPQTRRKLA